MKLIIPLTTMLTTVAVSAQVSSYGLLCNLTLTKKYGLLLEPREVKEEVVVEVKENKGAFLITADTSLFPIVVSNFKTTTTKELIDNSNPSSYQIATLRSIDAGPGEETITLRLDRRTGHFLYTRYSSVGPSDAKAIGLCKKIESSSNKF